MFRSLLGTTHDEGSTNSNVKLTIHLPFQSAKAGTELTGKVVCEVIAKEVISGEAINLSIVGKEIATTKVAGKRPESERNLCQMNVDLLEFCDRRLGPGRFYTFPFSIKLPKSLPSSLSFKSGDVSLKIEYRIIAEGYSTSKSREFQVSSFPLPDSRVPCLQRPVTQPIKSLKRDQGSLTLAARVKDTHIGRGDRIQVSLACRNDSFVDIQRIELKVQEIVCGDITPSREGNFGDHRTFKESIFVKKQLNIVGLRREAAISAQVKRASSWSSAQREQQYGEIYHELRDDKYRLEFLCPGSARDSYKGKLIHVKHQIKVKLITNSMTDNPSIVIPLKIGNPPNTTPRNSTTAAAAAQRPSRTRSNSPDTRRTERLSRRRSGGPELAASIVSLRRLVPLVPPVPINPHQVGTIPEEEARSSVTTAAPRSQSTSDLRPLAGASQDSERLASATAFTQSATALPPAVPAPEVPQVQPAFPPPASAAPPPQTQSTPSFPPASAAATAPAAFTYSTSRPPAASAPRDPYAQSTSSLPTPSAPIFEQVSATTTQANGYEVEIPFLNATPVPPDAIDAPTTVVEPEFIYLGGDAIHLEDETTTNEFQRHDNAAIAATPPPPPPPPPEFDPTLEILLQEMLICVEDFDIISTKLQNPRWRSLFGLISPDDFGSIIAHVNIEFDQPRVADLLAPHLNGGDNNFTCQYAAAAIKTASAWNRPTMVERLVPSCVDLNLNSRLILAELNEWDKIITAQYFNS